MRLEQRRPHAARTQYDRYMCCSTDAHVHELHSKHELLHLEGTTR